MDFADQPTQPKQPPWKLIAIIAGGVVLAVGILVGVFVMIRSNETPLPPPSPSKGEGAVVVTSDLCAADENPDACRIANAKQNAVAEKKGDACAAFKETADKDDCYWSVARASRDGALCAKISNSDISVRCVDELNVSIALAASDVALCDKIGDGQIKLSCKAVIDSTKGFACPNGETDCELTRVIVAANQAQDAEICRALDPKREANCRAQVLVNDPDRDGIDSTQEIVLYNTDPRKADTDGDGYSDGQEVTSGHDPLKK